MPYAGHDASTFGEGYTLTLTKRDLLLIRAGLEELMQIYTREEHLFTEIRHALAKLPSFEEAPAPRS